MLLDSSIYVARIALFGTALLIPTLSFAKTTEEADSIKLKGHIREVEVNGKRSLQLHSAMPTQIISEEEFKNQNVGNVADVAKHFAGVMVKDYGGIGGLKTISVRGLGAAHTGVSYDGLMVSDIQSGQIDLSQFSLENVSSVSLDNGQPMNLLQSARMFAMSSVLSLRTKLSDYDSSHAFSGHGKFKAGSFGLLNPSFLVQKYFTSRFALTLSADGVKSNGKYPFEININPYGKTIVKNDRYNTDVTSLKSELNAIYNFTSSESFSFKANQYYCERGLPGSVIFYNYNDASARILDRNYFSQIHYENRNSSVWQYLASAKWTNMNMRYSEVDNNYSSLPDHMRREKYRQNEYYLSGALQYRPVANLTLAAATDWWYNNLFSATNLSYKKDTKPTRQTALANVSAKYVAERFTFGGNLLFTATHETADSTFAAPDRRRLSPTLFASWQALDDGSLLLRAFYKNIFRTPTFTEVYYHDMGYKYLLPEKTRQFNLGLTYNSQKVPFVDDFSCTLDAYYNRITDKITIIYGMPFSTVRNIGVVKIRGCDVALFASKKVSDGNKFDFTVKYTFQKAQNYENDPSTYGDIIPYTPIHSGSASLTYSRKKFDLGYNLLYASRRYSGQNSDPKNRLQPYADQSIFGRYNHNKKLSLMAEMLNFANDNYAIVQYYPMPGRNYRFSVNYKF